MKRSIFALRKDEGMTEVIYHLSCTECGKDWWSEEAFPKVCPHCGKLRNVLEENGTLPRTKEDGFVRGGKKNEQYA